MSKAERLAILGSTGSIGTQTLDVVRAHPDRFSVEVLTAWNQAELLIAQAKEFQPNMVVIGNEAHYPKVKEALAKTDVKVFAGMSSITDAVGCDTVDTVVTALLGSAGLRPTLRAIEAGKKIALANKETLVSGGEIVCRKARENHVYINPIDSEHSAIFQCLTGEVNNRVEKIFLTGSGGPFRGRKAAQLQDVKPEQALKHPTWHMGRKISIDSATLMNKGLEMIEAKWLFGVQPSDIEVVIHPESIIHSLVSFADGSVKAQLGLPDMRLPIQYALTFPERLPLELPRLDLTAIGALHFEKPDTDTFRCLKLAYHAIEKGGNLPCIMNAANEVAVQAFLQEKIPFTGIADLIEKAMERVAFIARPDLEQLEASDLECRNFCIEKL
ncbi:MAG: 1-deoxy-D-xylulose-5-phosphate reductoisomerase [Bacteroides sp.]|nr:1-deoxy-D-xylulose-5-phosphate reductoisomerase [Bacteroides sp.]MCM1086391.1 1-deoxy-D-xylulose-5-phosphate reductoisomerase [Bacteroides sp.]